MRDLFIANSGFVESNLSSGNCASKSNALGPSLLLSVLQALATY